MSGTGIIWGIFPLEAIRCMVENDDEAGRILGRAIETAMIIQAESSPRRGLGPESKALNPCAVVLLTWQDGRADGPA
jgi:hypothetical protein